MVGFAGSDPWAVHLEAHGRTAGPGLSLPAAEAAVGVVALRIPGIMVGAEFFCGLSHGQWNLWIGP